MIVDTSIWADHFRSPLPLLSSAIAASRIRQHGYVTGELALGNPSDRSAVIETLSALPQARIVSHDDALQYVLEASLGGTGIGYVDAHLLASCSSFRLPLWTRDKRLAAQAERLGLLYSPD